MDLDLTGGLDARREYGFEDYPDTPDMRDAVNFWFCDDQGRFGMPRCVMEATGPNWPDDREATVNIAFPDGRVYSLRDIKCKGPVSNKDADGRPTIFAAGPIEFRLIDPFHKWTVAFSGECAETSSLDQMEGRSVAGEGRRAVPVQFEMTMDMAVPPWAPLTHVEEGLRAILTDDEIVYTHEWGPCHRQEQLFRGAGTLKIGDNEAYTFTGSGLRVRRQNIFKVSEFTGHVWQSALFASGKAFGTNNYAPRRNGKPSYSEGWIFDGKDVVPARVIQAQWLTRLAAHGDDVSLVLETNRGFHHIKGETFVSTFEAHKPRVIRQNDPNLAFSPYLQQANVRYTWDGEEAFGMMERSMTYTKLFPPAAENGWPEAQS